jgi:RimJ/RimL family protein N-acetyltransferase
MLTNTTIAKQRDLVEVRLVDGGVATLRPLLRHETAPVLAVFDAMSGLSRARRYLTGMPQLPPRLLSYLADVGRRDHVAWLATIDEKPVGMARYVAVDGCLAEVAFEVVDQHHNRGLGSALLDTITTVACANGFASVTASVHPGNRASLRLVRKLGLRLQLSDGLLEGVGPLRLMDPPRVDRAAVLDLLDRHRGMSGLNRACGQPVISAQ